MRDFAQLIKTLDSTNKTNLKVDALADYFAKVPEKDKVWTIAILSHRRPPRPVNTTLFTKEWEGQKPDPIFGGIDRPEDNGRP